MRKFIIFLTIIFSACSVPLPSPQKKIDFQITLEEKYSDKHISLPGTLLYVSIDTVTDTACMYNINTSSDIWAIEKTYPISIATRGLGCDSGSFKTPLGLHSIAEKIGAGQPIGTVFKDRLTNGEVVIIHTKRIMTTSPALITSRILWLQGEEDHNTSTYERYIYIHGLNYEWNIGKPFSGGCLLMRNTDVIELFDRVPKNTFVYITTSSDS